MAAIGAEPVRTRNSTPGRPTARMQLVDASDPGYVVIQPYPRLYLHIAAADFLLCHLTPPGGPRGPTAHRLWPTDPGLYQSSSAFPVLVREYAAARRVRARGAVPVRGGGHVQRRVPDKEPERPEVEVDRHDRHHRPVFRPHC